MRPLSPPRSDGNGLQTFADAVLAGRATQDPDLFNTFQDMDIISSGPGPSEDALGCALDLLCR